MKYDEDYKNAEYIDGAEAYPARWLEQSKAYVAELGARAQMNVRYGDSDRQRFDMFQPTGVSRGTMIFVHGGYWKALDKSYTSYLAEGALAKGWAVAMPSYDLCPDVKIADITRQIAAAVTEVGNRTFGKLALAGHSAGGHLVARMMDPLVLPADVRRRIENIVSISPVADLVPLLETTMNEVLKLDLAEAQAESPINMSPPHGVNVTIWVGADERPAFLEQSQSLSRAWGAKKIIAEGKHHFDVFDALTDPDSDIIKGLLGG